MLFTGLSGTQAADGPQHHASATSPGSVLGRIRLSPTVMDSPGSHYRYGAAPYRNHAVAPGDDVDPTGPETPRGGHCLGH